MTRGPLTGGVEQVRLPEPVSRESWWRRPRVLLVLVLVVCAVALVALSTGTAKRQLREAGLLPRLTPITELAFVPGQRLPPTRTSADRIDLRFQVTNDGTSVRTYTWVASMERETRTSLPLTTGVVVVGAGKTVIVPLGVPVPNCGLRQLLVISLPQVNEQLSVRFDDRATPAGDRASRCLP